MRRIDEEAEVLHPAPMRVRRLEDHIRELCARAVTAQDPELDVIFSNLQDALHEHNERLRKMAAAKLTAWRPAAATTAPHSVSRSPIECAICSQPIALEDSKVSEDGRPMHEDCYVAKLISIRPAVQPQVEHAKASRKL